MNKRTEKVEKSKEEKEYTEEELAKLEKSKLKRTEDRTLAVDNGVAELTLVLKDIVRTGILHLPTKETGFFDKIAARMIDAKASGLAGWVKKLGAINYNQNSNIWQTEALEIIGKMYLLTEAFRNINNLPEAWQTTVKNLTGWSQSPKELLQDAKAEIVKDIWLVIGQETTTTDDAVIIQRNWLIGVETNQTALILNFGTRFAPMDISVIPGSVIEAAVVFFPAIIKQRAVVKLQKGILKSLPTAPQSIPTIKALYDYKHSISITYPFANDIIVCLQNIRIGQHKNAFMAIDEEGSFMQLSADFIFEKQLNWLAITAGNYYNITAIIRDEKLFPLGIFVQEQYILI
jgi:hypothetical protein